MTSKLDLNAGAILYAQALDNKGSAEYWSLEDYLKPPIRLTLFDPRLQAIRDLLDDIQSNGRVWGCGSHTVTVKFRYSGECVIMIKPLTRDIGGRVSPVLVLLNALGGGRKLGAEALFSIERHLKRELACDGKAEIRKLSKILRRSRFLILLHMIIFSKRIKND